MGPGEGTCLASHPRQMVIGCWWKVDGRGALATDPAFGKAVKADRSEKRQRTEPGRVFALDPKKRRRPGSSEDEGKACGSLGDVSKGAWHFPLPRGWTCDGGTRELRAAGQAGRSLLQSPGHVHKVMFLDAELSSAE